MIKTVPLDMIRLDGGTQPRAAIDESLVAEYAEAMENRVRFPPVVAFTDGADTWLADGFHRWHAGKRAGLMTIATDLRQGSRRDAIFFSVGANAAHGQRRTPEDRRRAVQTLLGDPEWSRWSDRRIAKA